MRHLLSRTSIASLFAAGLIASAVTAAPPEDRSGRRGKGGDRGQGGEAGSRRMPAPLFSALDANSDGTISAQEIQNASTQLMTLDKDGDGSLSIRELMPSGRGMGRSGASNGEMRRGGKRDGGPQEDGMRGKGKRGEGKAGKGKQGKGKRGEGKGAGKADGQRDPAMMAKFFEKRDSDGDGKLSGEEIPERMQSRLGRVDANQDGSVSLEEMQSAMSKMGQKGGRRSEPKNIGTPGGDLPKRPQAE